MSENILEVKGLTKDYGDFVLDKLTFTVPKGVIMGLIGENGAGKSTTINCILNEISKTDGNIEIFGKDYLSEEIEIKDKIGVVFDENHFPDIFTPNEIGTYMSGIWLKRMGRDDAALWYDKVDFSQVKVLIVEWTHGNSDFYCGVDLPVFLYSTPQETMTYRVSRARDGAADSPFVTMVLQIEQRLLESQAHKAKIILSREGKVLSWSEYCKLAVS